MKELRKDRVYLLLIYFVAFMVGFFIGNRYSGLDSLWRYVMSSLFIVITIFVFSFLMDNSSVFDPYWSVAPFLAAGFWLFLSGKSFEPTGGRGAFVRIIILLVLLLIYGIRLTWNFIRGWKGFKQEDWRYVSFRKATGVLYWPVSLLGIHLFPALMVFLGSLSIYITIIGNINPMNWVDIPAILVTVSAILLEAFADKQLRSYNLKNPDTRKTMNSGLWRISRHPNYLGEILFWWGLYLFALAANPGWWWVMIGPVAITLMFIFASIPMMEKRMTTRREDYAEYRKKVPVLLPFGRRG